MSRYQAFPDAVLSQHLAVLGKTGSGKTSTAKLAVEQVVAEGARVCVLDPIKSDWWGLTSSANGKQAGLPFHILGGPRGHVPLHASAGKAVAEIVANGSLPLSILDMADFEPGGQAKFFVDFAPTLIRKMRGVVYLVIEEAHLFAPKERSGVGAENLSIHWAKTLATAGRSKGIRLVLVTQRTQALHNALLGSCDTLIAHRLTAPADQKPVVSWLQANVSTEVMLEVKSSLASLKTGHAWVCAGEAKLFKTVAFPRIATYDNTATPTGDGKEHAVKMAHVDRAKLASIIGDAVTEAAANDPRELKRQLADRDRRIRELEARAPAPGKATEVEVLTEADRARLAELATFLRAMRAEISHARTKAVDDAIARLAGLLKDLGSKDAKGVGGQAEALAARLERAGFTRILEKLDRVEATRPLPRPSGFIVTPPPKSVEIPRQPQPDPGGDAGPSEQRILGALAWLVAAGIDQPSKYQVAFLARYAVNRYFNNNLGAMRTAGLVDYPSGGHVSLTQAGRAAVTIPAAAPTRQAMVDSVMAILRSEAERKIFSAVASVRAPVTKAQIVAATGYTENRYFNNMLGALRTLGAIDYPQRGHVALSRMFEGLA